MLPKPYAKPAELSTLFVISHKKKLLDKMICYILDSKKTTIRQAEKPTPYYPTRSV